MRRLAIRVQYALVLIAVMFLGVSCAGTNTQHPSAAQVRTGLHRDAKPEWISGSVDDFDFSVPFSYDWRIDTAMDNAYWLSPYEVVLQSNGTPRGVDFGRPVNGGTYVTREYSLYRDQPATLKRLQQTLDEGCGIGRSSSIQTLGDVRGVEFYTGGAKGCGVGFAFEIGTHTYYLSRIVDIGATLPSLTDEMGRIVASVRD